MRSTQTAGEPGERAGELPEPARLRKTEGNEAGERALALAANRATGRQRARAQSHGRGIDSRPNQPSGALFPSPLTKEEIGVGADDAVEHQPALVGIDQDHVADADPFGGEGEQQHRVGAADERRHRAAESTRVPTWRHATS